MPATFPSSFASAAAGNSSDPASRRTSGRGDSGGFGEWGRRPNGATQTFRRPSLATANSQTSHQRDLSASVLSPSGSSGGAYVPPHISASRNGAQSDARLSRDYLLDLFKHHRSAGDLDDDLSDLFMGDFEPDTPATSAARWNRREELAAEVPIKPDICLNTAADTEPLGLLPMTAEEHEVFATSVNSPLKAPNPSAARDGTQREGPGLRKLSMSHGHGLNTVTSPTSSRPMNRRRELSDTFSRDQLTSPTSTRFGRDDGDSGPPPALLRRKTDGRDAGHGRLEEQDEGDEPSSMASGPFGLSRRVTTGPLSAGVNGPQSPWSQPASGGAFGSFSLSNGSGARRPGGGLVRGESRFKGLMSKDSVESTRSPIQEKPSHGSLNRAGEYHDDADQQSGDNLPVGSAALGGAHDESHGRHPGRTMEGQSLHDLDTSEAPLPGSGAGQPFGQLAEEPSSPTSTNPYQSPEREPSRLNDMGPDDIDLNNLHLPGLGGYHQAENLGSSTRGLSSFESRPFERPGTLGGPAVTRGFPGLGSIGALPAVSSPGGWGTPGRERAFDFGDSSFRQDSNAPPALSGLGSIGPFSSGSRTAERSGNAIGSSRLGSLFPTAMQEQLRGADSSKFRQLSTHDLERSEEAFDAFNARAQAQGFSQATVPGREMESPFYANRTHDIASTSESSPAQASQRLQPIGSQTNLAKLQSTDQSQQALGGGANISSLPPAAQQKTMVMPDRIRWIYRDPQGNTQGPWSGLEMHDWYRAGFFSPELLVKKAEDPDYEPLAQLIRRIGNSREPFLVPQIGIPGPPSSAASGAWPPPAATQQPPPSSGGAQPPFASSFPTFGTTLTAEQQNALERRKQEEQYLMARQKEHLAQQQIYHRMQMQTQGFPNAQQQQQQQQQSLQHHSSAQSLQSQQSLGSIGSPPTYPSGTSQGLSGGFEGSLRPLFPGGPPGATDSLSHIEEEQPTRHHDQQYAEPSDNQQAGPSEQSIAASIADRSRLAQEQAAFDQNQGPADDQSYDSSLRLDEFHSLRNETSVDESQNFRDLVGRFGAEQQPQIGDNKSSGLSRRKGERVDDDQIGPVGRSLTLTEQVQKAASAKISSPASGNQSPWAKVDKPVIDSHPASQTSSPLPAPAARRSGGQSVADALAADTASQRNSPVVDTPTTSIAPWARETVESQKQPSLKEIQEAEARRAAKQEEVAAAMRRAALEKELANQVTAPAPGLPSSSTWASGDTSMSPSASSASAWAKPSTRKSGTAASSSAKKTLQQIQKEEEALARRQKALSGATTSSSNLTSASTGAGQAVSSGKRYADLASRTAQATSPPSGPWTTVGASGKTKAPSAGLPSTLNRTASGSMAAAVTGAPRPKPAPTPGRTASGSVAPSLNAQDEFKKWAVGELRPDLKKGILVDEFVGSLLNLPSDTDLITEAVHSASSTMDSRHFAEEFVKRRALADKGKTQPPSGSSSLSQPTSEGKGSGWSEVASRKPAATAAKEESTSGFKVVPAKKKAGKR